MTESKAIRLTVGELFQQRRRYTIPIYQRNYAWGREQIEQLMTDVIDAAQDPSVNQYFLGNLIVARRTPSSDDFEKYEVIDGQQRLTTLFILTRYLLAEAPEVFTPQSVGTEQLHYQSRPRATQSLLNLHNRAATGTSSTLVSDDLSEDSIVSALRVIQSFNWKENGGSTSENPLKRRDVADFLLNSVHVVQVTVPQQTDLNRYFEIMNTRGVQLNAVDIVKARLMSFLPDEERNSFAKIWNACADSDYYIQMSLTRGDTDARSKLFGPTWGWLEASNFNEVHRILEKGTQSEQGFTVRSDELTLDAALAFYGSNFRSQEDGSEDGSLRFDSFVNFQGLLLQTLALLSEHDPLEASLDDKQLITRFEKYVYSGSLSPTERVRAFGYALLRTKFLLDNYVLKREYTAHTGDEGDWSLLRLRSRKDSRNNLQPTYKSSYSPLEEDLINIRIRLLQSALRITYTAPRTMHWVTAALAYLFQATRSDDIDGQELLDVLEDYARRRVEKAYDPRKRQFLEEGEGFGVERIVFTYLDYLLVCQDQRTDFKFMFRNSIEHFAPQKPSADQSTPYDFDVDDFGNLALLTVSANSHFTNQTPTVKSSVRTADTDFQRIREQSPKLEKMAALTNSGKGWTRKQVQQHRDEMLDLLSSDLLKNT